MAPVEERLTGVRAIYMSGADTLRVKRSNVTHVNATGPSGFTIHADLDGETVGLTIPAAQDRPEEAERVWKEIRSGFPDDVRERTDAWFRDGAWDIIL